MPVREHEDAEHGATCTDKDTSHYKSYRLTWLLPASGLWFVIGYGLRTAGAFGFHGSLAVYISSLCLIAVVPYASPQY